ncbi:hypothetical protein ACQPZX_16440 [Actinoplanes sp. CA-142083]|uniref:hypothetical protein n=1 Tax=Actinoplanes sp. CA-142083 TaxID=3239903 RepID=UPI003D8BA927
MSSRPRRAAAVVVVLFLVLGGGLTYCSADWKSSVFAFDLPGGDYRVRLTGSSGNGECARLERETNFDEFTRWRTAGKDCAWPKVAGGDGWLAGGQVVRVSEDGGDQTKDWILFGIVPAAAAEVVLTLADGKERPAATKAAGGGANRLYALHVPGVGDSAEVISIVLHDARGGEIRVY